MMSLKLSKRKILIIILSLQFIFMGIIIFYWIGLKLPLFRQIIAFIYLTYIPGILLLGIIGANNLRLTETVLYSVGLSLSFLMFIGFVMNTLYPLVGILKPITEIPLFVTISTINLLLLIVLYYNKSKFEIKVDIVNKNDKAVFLPLLFTLLPLLSVFGSYLLNYYNNNKLLLTLYFIISFVPILIALNKIPHKIYSFTIWTISISLLFSVSLSVRHLSGHLSDAILEYYFAKLVQVNGFWDPSIHRNKNAMLRIVLLHPIYSTLMDLSLKDVFRVIHPILYSLTPVALYIAFKRQLGEKIAFFSSFFFMAFYSFYVILSRNTRTGIAELFLALFILTMVDKNINSKTRSILLIVFALSIVVSHYGTAYVLLIVFISTKILSGLIRKYKDFKININSNVLYLLLVFTFIWYIYNSGGAPFETLIYFYQNIITQLTELFNPELSYVAYASSRNWTVSIEIVRDLILFASILIVIGVFTNSFKRFVKNEKINIQDNFLMFSIVFLGIVLSSFLPTKSFNPARVYHLALCFLAPFVVLGFIDVCRGVANLFRSKHLKIFETDNILKIFSLFLVIFFLFSSGFISEAVIKDSDYSPNIIISKPRALNINNDTQYIKSFYGTYLFDYEVASARWLYFTREVSIKICMDWGSAGSGIFQDLMGPNDISHSYVYVRYKRDIPSQCYIYLNYINKVKHVSLVNLYPPEAKDTSDVFPLNTSLKIYTNEGSEIYFKD